MTTMTEHLIILESSVQTHIDLCRDLHKLVLDQRALIKNRDLKGLEEITKSLADKYQDFSAAQLELQQRHTACLNEMGLAQDLALSALADHLSGERKSRLSQLTQELYQGIKKFQEDNTLNLMLVKSFYQTIGQVLKFYQGGEHLLYSQDGNIKVDGQANTALNKTV